MHLTDPVVKTASYSQLAGSAAFPQTIAICLSSAQEIALSAPLTSGLGTVSLVLVERLCVCMGAVPPIPGSASHFGDLGPSLLHHFASKQPTLGVMPLGAVGAAPVVAMCLATLGKWRERDFPESVGNLGASSTNPARLSPYTQRCHLWATTVPVG